MRLRAIVVSKLSSEVSDNDIQTRPSTGEIKVLGKYVVYQTNTLMNPPQLKSADLDNVIVSLDHKVLFLISSMSFPQTHNSTKREFPNDSSIVVAVPSNLSSHKFVMVEPRTENKNQEWPPVHLAPISEGKIVLENKTKKPITTGKDIKTSWG